MPKSKNGYLVNQKQKKRIINSNIITTGIPYTGNQEVIIFRLLSVQLQQERRP